MAYRIHLRRLLTTAIGGVTVLLAAGLPGAVADEPVAAPPATAVRPVLGLDDCIRIGLERQPGLAGVRASLASAVIAQQSVEKTGPVAGLFARDLAVRKQQSGRGVAIGEAELRQAEYDAVYSIVRCYYTVIYAHMQELVARDFVEDGIGFYRRQVQTLAKSPEPPKGIERAEALVDAYYRLARARLFEATTGASRAEAALREAMGLGPDCPFTVRDARLPTTAPVFSREQVVQAALCRRGEVAQSALFAEIVRLEIQAQARQLNPFARTVAISADLHSRGVPLPVFGAGTDYRPGAIAPELPPFLTGSRADRIDRATALSGRADAVVDKTRGLVALEAEDAFFRYVEAQQKVVETAPLARPENEDPANPANPLLKAARVRFGKPDEVAQNLLIEMVVVQARATANEALFQQVLALANLERVTAGGVCAAFTAPVAPTAGPVQAPAIPRANGRTALP
jgi:hypothetical protein